MPDRAAQALHLAVTFVRASADALDVLAGGHATVTGPPAAVTASDVEPRPTIAELAATHAMSIHHGIRVAIAAAFGVLLASRGDAGSARGGTSGRSHPDTHRARPPRAARRGIRRVQPRPERTTAPRRRRR
jgi:hypothetical protein